MFKNKNFLLFLLFFLAFFVHLFGINKIGRTWDEQYKIDFGVIALGRIVSFDFSRESWNQGLDHPMIGKYIYGFFGRPQMVLIQKDNEIINIEESEIKAMGDGNYILTGVFNNFYAVPYDYTLPRIISALLNSLAVVFTMVLALRIIGNVLWGFLAGVFLLLTPRFIFLGQLVTFESLSVFLFCLIILVFYKLLKSPTKLKLFLYTGILCGLFFWIRYNNVIVFPFLAGWTLIHYKLTGDKKIFNLRLLLIPIISFLVGFLTWPALWIDFPKYLIETLTFQGSRVVGLSFYFWEYLLITTPIPILIGATAGIYFCIRNKSYWNIIFLWWILCVFVLYTISVIELGGTRYIVILYPAMSILAAYGYLNILKKKFVWLIVPLIAFMFYEQAKIHPYYLDYYNHFVGGVAGAKSRGYDFSWWGEGQREVGIWVNKNVPENSSVSKFVTPKYVFPQLKKPIKDNGYLDRENFESDYVVVSEGHELSEKFLSVYKIVYEAKADGVALVSLYKKNK